MRRALIASALSVTLAALLPRALKIDGDIATTAQLALAALLFLLAWAAHSLKGRRET